MRDKSEIIKKLVEIGLSRSETEVYLAMLSLGETTIKAISGASGIKRTTIYQLIENLRYLGLVSVKNSGFKKRYFAEGPKRLATLVERKKNEFLDVLPSLEALYTLKGNDMVIKTYEGIEAMKSVYDELLHELRPDDEYLVIGDPERWDTHAKEYFKNYIKRRLKIDLNVRLLLSYSDTAKEYRKFEKNFKEKVRLLPENYDINANLVITKNMAIIHQLDNPAITIVIESKSLISLQKNLFEILWKFSE